MLREAAAAPVDLIPFPEQLTALCNALAWQAVLQSPEAVSPETALPLMRKAAELEPDNFLYQNTLGAVLYRVGRYEEAIRCLEANVPRSGDLSGWDLYLLAMSHHRSGQSNQALRCFERANASVKTSPSLDDGQRQELADFRAEAEKVLGLHPDR